ncbi:hypothetical protein P4V43_24025 [Brevibacillus fortis]|uniref:hypothetical protein n=1 Tax=Brevibacillus fortis TaxID=2126352 RepID=UPI00130495A4|nr:hypothetical protein [Brevibacillus fortis]MED1784891.1 hypothetical protein [Brevibacillus fortis]
MTTIRSMITATSHWLTFAWIGGAHRNLAFIPVTSMFMVKMTIVNVINMIVMSDFCMSASRTVLMRMLVMDIMFQI